MSVAEWRRYARVLGFEDEAESATVSAVQSREREKRERLKFAKTRAKTVKAESPDQSQNVILWSVVSANQKWLKPREYKSNNTREYKLNTGEYKSDTREHQSNTGEYKLKTRVNKLNAREYKSNTGEHKLNTREHQSNTTEHKLNNTTDHELNTREYKLNNVRQPNQTQGNANEVQENTHYIQGNTILI